MSDSPNERLHPARAKLYEDLLRQLTEELAPRLEIEGLLGRGTAAAVYLAREPALKRLVAVKVLAPELSTDWKGRLRFEREAQWAARVSHPNVVAVYWVDVLSSGLPYIVMQHVRGRSLEERLKAEGPLEVAEVRRILADLASGLAAAHGKGIVHRDVRPANILYKQESGRVFLTDFGIAATLTSGDEKVEPVTTRGHVLGDPRYVSPEHWSDEDLSEYADIYSLGLVGFELLTGESPYLATDAEEFHEAHVGAAPRKLRDLRPDADEALERLLERCLDKTPLHRPAARDLGRHLRDRAATARMPDIGSEASERPGRPPEPVRETPDERPRQVDRAGLRREEAAPPLRPPPDTIRLHTLGSLDLLARDGRQLHSVLAQPKRIALLVYLAIGAYGGFKRRDSLLGVFWPESEQERARQALRQAVHILRRGLGAHILVSRGSEEIGIDPAQLWCDTVAFEAGIDAGRSAEALDRFPADLLPGFYISDSPEFERWLDSQRQRVRRRASDAAWSLSDQSEREGDLRVAAEWGRRALESSPFDETSVCRLIELLDRVGDRAGAIRTYDGFARILAAEHETEPAPETQALLEKVRVRT